MSRFRVVFIYAPFGSSTYPALGISQFKTALINENIECDILYFNLEFAKKIGIQLYEALVKIPHHLLFCEWLFSSALFGESSLADSSFIKEVLWSEYPDFFSPSVMYDIMRIRDMIPDFFDNYTNSLDWSQYGLIGFSSVFQQQCASLALAKRIKNRFPDSTILFGGPNCFAQMGENLPGLFPFIDFVCTGEGDIAVPALIKAISCGDTTPVIPGIVSRVENSILTLSHSPGSGCNLDSIPYPDYKDYFSQLSAIEKPKDFSYQVLIETSRGCSWGEKSQCTFCGFNGNELTFRSKSPGRIIEEVRYLSEMYGKNISFADNILAKSYFKEVIPALASIPDLMIFLELKGDLTKKQASLLANAGIKRVHAGIESLSNSTLKLMRKGTNLVQSLQTLKWCKQYGVTVNWNLLYGFPGEDPLEYQKIMELIPKIIHLPPPRGPNHLRFDRFSKYHRDPAAYGIINMTPKNAYKYTYHSLSPREIDTQCYMFDAEYNDQSELYARDLTNVIREWQSYPEADFKLFIRENSIYLIDTRTRGETREYSYGGLEAQIYVECDAARSVESLKTHFKVSSGEITTILEKFVNERTMIKSGNNYLSLAIEIDGPETH